MKERPSREEISSVISKANTLGILDDEDSAAIFYDLSLIEERIKNLINLCPQTTLHAIAVKANPLTKILTYVKNLNVGCEAASLPELYLAEKLGFQPNKIVFDSPAKTKIEIEYAAKLGIHINADSLEELEIIDETIKRISSSSTFGIRINPQVGMGKISATSVGGEYSKFGVPIKEYRKELIEAFKKYAWLKGVHVHIGSQGCSIELLIKGIEKVYNFVLEANSELIKNNLSPISIFDIGGGIPVSYHAYWHKGAQYEEAPSINEYFNEMRKRFPELFSNKFKLITEFGRYIFANSGWTISKVEYVKRESNVNTAIIHVGADLLIRRAYAPEEWHHDISVADKYGNIKTKKDYEKYIIAGPLCFASDIVARNIELPNIEKGDIIIIHDTGAYTLSMWSRYNSRQIPKVIGYYNNGEKIEIIKERESLESILKFWS